MKRKPRAEWVGWAMRYIQEVSSKDTRSKVEAREKEASELTRMGI